MVLYELPSADAILVFDVEPGPVFHEYPKHFPYPRSLFTMELLSCGGDTPASFLSIFESDSRKCNCGPLMNILKVKIRTMFDQKKGYCRIPGPCGSN